MTRRRILVFTLMLAFFAAAFLILFFDLYGGERPVRVYNISMLVRGKASDSWTSVRQGAEQAAGELGAELSFITLSQENDSGEQIALLWRELEDGTDAIILSAADYEGLSAAIGRMTEKVPVISVESPVNHEAVAAYISADNYDMGMKLGNRISSDMGRDGLRVFVLGSSEGCDNLRQRRQGLVETLVSLGHAEIVDIPLTEALDAQRWPAGLGRQDAVVALEPSALEAAAQFFSDNSNGGSKLYGIGNSGKIASFLDLGIISAAVVQNDFGSGYLAITAAVSALENHAVAMESGVEYRIIDSANMYDTENQRLLFPFVR